MRYQRLALLLAALTCQLPPLASEEDLLVPEALPEERPVDKRAKIFPAGKAAESINFAKVAYFRTGRQKLFGLEEILKADPKFAGEESVYGLVLENRKHPLDDHARKDLVATLKAVPVEKISTDLRRPWAGGIRFSLVAFASDDSPLFQVSLQTSTPTEIAFEKAWPVGPDAVRGQSYPEFFKSFYHEVDDARLGAELFAIALELATSAPPTRPGTIED